MSVAVKSGPIMLVLPLKLYRVGPEFYCEDQAHNGLRLWLENFSSVTLCCPTEVQQTAPRAHLPLTGMIEIGRLIVMPLPSVGKFLPFMRMLLPTIRALKIQISQHRHLQFAIGGLWGDWGAVSILLASAMGRKAAVWTDSVASASVATGIAGASGARRYYLKLVASIMWQYEKLVVRKSALGLFHGMDTYAAYSPHSSDPHLVHDVHLNEHDRISGAELAAKMERVTRRKVLIIYAGRVHPIKGPFEWIETLSKAKDGGLSFSATWFGDGPQLEEARDMVCDLGLSRDIVFPGPAADRQSLMLALREADIFLFCHKIPESPRCLVESLISGTPIVGYESAFASDLLARNQGGVLTPSSPAALSATLISLSTSPATIADLAKRAADDGFGMVDTDVFRHRSDLIKSIEQPSFCSS